jgi:hypothetical protein
MNDFKNLAETLEANTKAVQDYRRAHIGRVPRELFEALLPVSGFYTCVEFIAETPDGIALRQRDADVESGLAGMFHIPGCVLTACSNDALIRTQLAEEYGMPNFDEVDLVPLPGFTLHDEPFRGSRTLALRFAFRVPSTDGFTSGVWKTFTREEIAAAAKAYTGGETGEIVPHHIAGLLWYFDEQRPIIGELWDYLPLLPRVY